MVYREVFFEMSPRTVHIKEVKKDTKSWAVRVMVEAKTQPRLPARGVKRYQRILLVDETGQKISATIFDPDIEHFKDMFTMYKTYNVSNASVSKIEEKYDKFGYPYQWIINSKTACNPDPESGIPRYVIKSEYGSIGNLKTLVRQNIFLDVVTIVIQKGELRSFILNNKDTKLLNHIIHKLFREKVVVLTLWNAVAEAEGDLIDKATDTLPIIRATQLLVSAHRGTVIELEPDIPEVVALKTWRSNNLKCIVDAISAKDYFRRVESSAVFPTDQISLHYKKNRIFRRNFSDGHKSIDRFTVEVAAMVIKTEQKYYYMACKKCFSSVDADYDYEYTCAMCGEKTQTKPRERIYLCIFDSTGSFSVTVFGTPVISLMQMDSEMCMSLSDKYSVTNLRLKEIHDVLENNKVALNFKHTVVKSLFPGLQDCSIRFEDVFAVFSFC
ncbi:hypothetical protein ACJIZ3_000168 [Penstemon smallii]|uniref:Replication protein A 70 kDa DNA-binding subunit B/D first OB fold domain-containing protein n=1 Tax=Penstemon smallii TaxID=265156 RepID=A0ABD3R9L9_9LAMI